MRAELFFCAGLLAYLSVAAQEPQEPAMPESDPAISAGGVVGEASGGATAWELIKSYNYKSLKLRDPFMPVDLTADFSKPAEGGKNERFEQTLQRFDVGQLNLLGILWDVESPRAMLKDPTGKVHLIQRDAKVGRNNGYVAVIREGEVVVVEVFDQEGKQSFQTRVMKIKK